MIRKIRVGQLHGFTTTGGGLAALHRDAGLYSLPLMFNNMKARRSLRDKIPLMLILPGSNQILQ